MLRSSRIILYSIFSIVCLIGCQSKSSLQEQLTGNWLISPTSIKADTSTLTYTKWQLSANSKFSLSTAKGQMVNGSWQVLKDSSISLAFDPQDTTLSIDSTALKIEKGQTTTLLFHNGSMVGQIKEGVKEFISPLSTYKVVSVDKAKLTLQDASGLISFSSQKQLEGLREMGWNSIGRGLIGLIFLLTLCFFLSTNRKAINWRIILSGILMQIIFAVLVFKVPFIKTGFEWLAGFFVVVLEFTKSGSNFLFGGLLDVNNVGYLFAFQVLPTIIFFSALTSLLYYLGVLQKVVYGLAWVMSKTLKLSGAESLSTAANIFLGQTEAPLMVKPFIPNMTRSEMLCIMVGGMASIAGGVLAAYVGFLGGSDPVQQQLFATHLLTASILSAPATIVASKMLIPETEKVNEELNLPREKMGANVLEAITNGTSDGIRLAINVGAMLLVFTAFIAMINYGIKNGIGEWTGLNDVIRSNSGGKIDGLSFQLILGYIFSPMAVMIGIPADDMVIAGQLLGEKTVLNEFYAYSSLARLRESGAFMHAQTIIILTYALCGFSNFASIGIQIGGISIMAPNQKTLLSQLGMKALIGGTIAGLMTASIAGMFF